jgi:hypothetical protein
MSNGICLVSFSCPNYTIGFIDSMVDLHISCNQFHMLDSIVYFPQFIWTRFVKCLLIMRNTQNESKSCSCISFSNPTCMVSRWFYKLLICN